MKYNTFTKKDYIFAINNVKKKNINMLGLYRSILENEKLDLSDKIEMRELLNEKTFYKHLNFIRLKILNYMLLYLF